MRTSKHSLLLTPLIAICLFARALAANANPPSARDVVDHQIQSALAVLQDAKLTLDQKRDRIGQIADQHTDFETLSRITLGRYWRDLAADQRAAFVQAFRQHLANIYGKVLNGYTDEDVKVAEDHQESNGDWTVRLSVIGTINGARRELVKVDCRLRRKAEWKVIDVAAEGVSVASLFRAQFQEIMANGGIDRLLKLLREKTTKTS